MKIINEIIITLIASIVFVIPTFCQDDGDPVSIGTYRKLHSKILNEDRLLLVNLPRGYDETTISYPVLYILYGGQVEGYFAEAVHIVCRMIIVGVKNTDRYRDCLPINRNGEPGGAANFLQFFSQELIPFIDQSYRTKNFRILLGPQAGAAFSLYALTENPELFRVNIVTNPFWIGASREYMINKAKDFFNEEGFLNNFLFLTSNTNDDNDATIDYLQKFKTIVEQGKKRNFTLVINQLEKRESGIISSPGLRKGLETYFAEYKFPNEIEIDGLKDLKAYYQNLSQKYGYEIDIPEFTLVRQGDRLDERGKVEEAKVVFEYIVEKYPHDLNSYARLADLHRRWGNYDLAIQYYEQLLERRWMPFIEGRLMSLKNEIILATSVIDTLKVNIPRIMKRDSIPGVSVAVVSDQKTLWISSYGFADKTKQRQITNETLFSIQSMSKNFTALAVLMAVQDGLLDLDTPIKKYLPEFSVHSQYEDHPEEKITLRHLLSHHAGFTHEAPIGSNFDHRPHTFQEHVESISDTWLRYPVGYHFAYSNLGIDLAGYILQKQSGMPFELYFEQKVLLPLGMKSSTFDMSRIKKSNNHAIGHLAKVDSLPLYIPMIPAGGLYTNAAEMASFLRFHINSGAFEGNRLIQENIFEEMYSVAFPLLSQKHGYGFGLWKQMIGNSYQYYHGGAGYGFVSAMIIYPELKLGVVVLTNSEDHDLSVFHVRMMIEPIIRSLYGQEQPVPVSITEADSDALPVNHPRIQHILGRYGHGGNSRIVEIKDSVLGISIEDEFYPAKVFMRNGDLVGKFGKYSEFMFLSDLNDKPGTLVIKNRWMDTCHFFDYNDGPNDKPGPAKPVWKNYLGQYQMFYYGHEMGPFTISMKNGYLYFDDQRCLEFEPGLFFVYDGAALDFRTETPMGSNIKLFKK